MSSRSAGKRGFGGRPSLATLAPGADAAVRLPLAYVTAWCGARVEPAGGQRVGVDGAPVARMEPDAPELDTQEHREKGTAHSCPLAPASPFGLTGPS